LDRFVAENISNHTPQTHDSGGSAAQYIAFDLGASNGRCVVGRFDGSRLTLEVVHRFENCPVELLGHLYWDVLGLYQNIEHSLYTLGSTGRPFASIGIDTWGCDFALLDRQGKLVANPYCYRDQHTQGMYAEAFRRVSKEDIFASTGLQFMELNTLFQLLAMHVHDDPALQSAHTFLHLPDLLNYWLTGVTASEYTNASTSQLLDATTRDWAFELIQKLGLPLKIFPPIVQPGERLGPLLPELALKTGLGPVQVIATASHDTAAAIAATPTAGGPYAYISSGTWGLLGQEIDQPLLTSDCMRLNITNEGGAFGKITLLRNIANLWFLQESRRHWSKAGKQVDWSTLIEMASQAPAFTAFIDPDDASFILPGDIPSRIQSYCQKTGQTVPHTRGQILRVVLESLALKYRYTLERVQAVSGVRAETFHIIGGGSRNQLLNQFTANAINLPVVAGPDEATAAGNILVQMVGLGHLGSLEEARCLVRDSFDTETYLPEDTSRWDEAYTQFLTSLRLDKKV
jgi:rhamnulokinase